MTKVVIEKECPVPFSSLVKGDVFMYNGKVFIKTENMLDSSMHYDYNCVCLQSGYLSLRKQDDEVVFCKELIVK